MGVLNPKKIPCRFSQTGVTSDTFALIAIEHRGVERKGRKGARGGEAGADKSVHHLSCLNKSDSPIPKSRQDSIRTPRFVKENLFFRPLANLMSFTLYFFSQPSEPQN